MSILSEQSVEKFKEGYNCAQIVLSSFSERYGISKETAYKMATGFGGGARNGQICGAVAGAIMVIGLKYGNDSQDEGNTKKLCYEKTVEFTEMFKQRQGSIVCKDLLDYDISDPEQMKYATENQIFMKICPVMIKEAIENLEKLGYAE